MRFRSIVVKPLTSSIIHPTMVQIRKGGVGGALHSNTSKKSFMGSHHHSSNNGKVATYRNAILKLTLLVVICGQLLFLGYKVVLVVLPPTPSKLSTTTSTTTASKHSNVRHVSRSDIIKDGKGGAHPQDEGEASPSQSENIEIGEQQQQTDALKRFGTGPAREGFVVDLVGERQHRFSFAKMHEKLQSVVSKIQQQVQPEHITKIDTFIRSNNHNVHGNKGTVIKPCEYYHEQTSSTDATTRWLSMFQSECIITSTPPQQLYGFNSVPFTRYYSKNPCGHDHHASDSSKHNDDHHQLESVGPDTAVLLPPFDSKLCKTTSRAISDICMTHVFPFDITNHDLASVPTVLIYDATRTTDQLQSATDIPTQSIACDVPCQYDTNLPSDIMNGKNDNRITELGVYGTNWKLKQTLSDPYYNANAKIERTDYRRDIYYSTTSFKSSVPLSYYNFDTYNLRNTQAIDFQTSKNAATYLLDTNCGYGNRHKWVAAVQVVLNVEAYGSCSNNAPLQGDETISTREGRIQLMRKNRIVLAFEAGTDKDHITSIVWEALMSGSVPAIFGASNLEQQHLPPNSAIYTTNYNNWDKFAAYVSSVANNETLWNTYQQWRTDEVAIQKFEERYAFVKSAPSPECRVCRWAYSKLYGLGFNHTTQVIQPTKLSRNLCTSIGAKANVVTGPFRERWYVANDFDQSSATDGLACTPSASSTDAISVYGPEMGTKYEVERNVVAHDGIIDITVTKIVNADPMVNGPLRLRLEIDNVRNTEGASFRDVHTWVSEATRTPLMSSVAIQDEYAKVTVIANFITPISSPVEGVLDIEISPGKVTEELFESLRIRIILEDTNPIHDKLTEYFPSTFARRMMHDFIDPLELYYGS